MKVDIYMQKGSERKIINLLIFIFIFLSVGCDRIYKFLDKEGAEEKELVGEAPDFRIGTP